MVDQVILDQIDRRILDELTADARVPIAELARRVGLSKTPVAARVKQMEDSGLIAGYRAIISPIKMGLANVTFVEVRLNDTREKALAAFNAAVQDIPEVEDCYMIAGGFDYLIKVRTRDIADYRRIMGEVLSNLPHVTATSSYVAMDAIVEGGLVSGEDT